MPSITPSVSTTTRLARVSYLNSAPFFHALRLNERCEVTDGTPRELGLRAASGELDAGLLPLVDYFRLAERFERLGPFGIAVRGRARSALLFSRKPIRQLEGAVIAVTEDTSTTLQLLRLLLETRYKILPAAYERRLHAEKRSQNVPAPHERRQESEADALLLIGDEALRFKQANAQYPFEIDLGFEWWLWQHLPFVFAVWAVRADAPAQEHKELELAVSRALGGNLNHLDAIAQEHAPRLNLAPEVLQDYLSGFIYRLSQPEEEGIAQFKKLLHEHHLL